MKRYAEYKDSGIEWIGEIPQDWEIKKVKFIYDIISGNGFKEELQGRLVGDYPFCKVSDINGEDIFICTANNYVDNEEVIENRFNIIPPNSFLMAKIGEALKKNHRKINTVECIIDNNMQAITVKTSAYIMYAFYMWNCINMVWFDNGGTIPSINNNKLLNSHIPNTSLAVQQDIANYLDQKTSAIDTLIADKQKLIGLIKEKRQAIISETVTKGLDKTAKMKDSGVEWIGEIPKEWETIAVSKISTVVRGASPRPAGDPMYFNGSDVPWITVAEVTKGDGLYLYETEEFLTLAGKEKSRLIEPGTLLLSNSGATLGVPKISMIAGCINDGSVAFLNLSIDKLFLAFIFKNLTYELRRQMQGYGQPNLNTTIIKNIVVPKPPLEIQKRIVQYIILKTEKIDNLITDTSSQIEKLKEYRQSIISEAVTGKVAI